MPRSDVESRIGRGIEASLPAYSYDDPKGGSYWVGYVDLEGASAATTPGAPDELKAVAYYAPGSKVGCYVLPAERRGKQLGAR